MIARFDHRPKLTAALALATIALTVVVIALAALLVTAAPPAATSAIDNGRNPGAPVRDTGDFYGEGWNNYGHDLDRPQPAQTGTGADSAVDRHADVVAAYQDNK